MREATIEKTETYLIRRKGKLDDARNQVSIKTQEENNILKIFEKLLRGNKKRKDIDAE